MSPLIREPLLFISFHNGVVPLKRAHSGIYIGFKHQKSLDGESILSQKVHFLRIVNDTWSPAPSVFLYISFYVSQDFVTLPLCMICTYFAKELLVIRDTFTLYIIHFNVSFVDVRSPSRGSAYVYLHKFGLEHRLCYYHISKWN